MLTERAETFITVLPNGVLQVRTDTVIERDGMEISRLHHRASLEPGDPDMSVHEKRTQNVASLIWTADVIQAYRDKKPPVVVLSAQSVVK